MDIHYQLTPRDVLAGRAHAQARMREHGAHMGFWSALALGMLGGLLWLMWIHPGLRWLAGAFLLLLTSLVVWNIYVRRVGHHIRWLARAAGAYALNLAPPGIMLHMPGGETIFHAWPEVAALEITPDYLIFYTRAGAAFAVPCAALEPDGAQALSAEARKLWAAAPANAGQTLSGEAAIPESPAAQAWVNLREAAHLALFLPVEVHAFRPTYGALAIHAVALAFMLGAISYLQALPIPLFNSAGLAPFGVSILLVAVWAWLVSAGIGQRSSLLRLLVMAVAALLFVSMAGFFSYQVWLRQFNASSTLGLAWHAAIALWIVAVLARVVRALYGRSRLRALSMAGMYVLMTFALSVLAPQGPLYLGAASLQPGYATPDEEGGAAPGTNPPDLNAPNSGAPGQNSPGQNSPGEQEENYLDEDEGDGAPNPADAVDVEGVYYRQPELVQKAVAGIRPHQLGETGLYFVGFAGDGSEHEFFNEVRYARNLLDKRFNTAGRSLMLINSYDTLNDTPLANTHNLEAALQGLAQRMDKEHDVLFLFLSSHGAQDHSLEVLLDPMQMNDLKAERLKELLDQSGIRNRVIVVSACYSGGFLDVLKDDNTLVLTASRRDHVAYGCGDITEYTYFGEAYFVRALAHSDSFVSAFDDARGRIAAREQKEGMDPSGPQISVGRNIVEVLRRLKIVPADGAALKAGASGRPAPPAVCPQGCSGEGSQH